MDRLPVGLTDESNDVWMDRNFPRYWVLGKFCTPILMGIFTVNLADGWMDRTDDGCIDRQWNHIWVGRQMSHATDICMDLSC